jgi:hypothetical protein
VITLKKFLKLPPNRVFATGESVDSPEGLFMTGSGNPLRWVAVKGGNQDWALYTQQTHWSYEMVERNGDKVNDEANILRALEVSPKVLERYRH